MGGKKIADGDTFHLIRLTYGNQKEKSHRLWPAGFYSQARLQKKSSTRFLVLWRGIFMTLVIMLIWSSTIRIKMVGVRLPFGMLTIDLLFMLLFQLFFLLWIFVAHGSLLLFQIDREKSDGLELNLINH